MSKSDQPVLRLIIEELERMKNRIDVLQVSVGKLRQQVWDVQRYIDPPPTDAEITKYFEFKLKVLQRDDNTCQDCGFAETGSMVVHHIMMQKYHPDLKYDVNNGVTLCNRCHTVRHGRNHFMKKGFDPNTPIM